MKEILDLRTYFNPDQLASSKAFDVAVYRCAKALDERLAELEDGPFRGRDSRFDGLNSRLIQLDDELETLKGKVHSERDKRHLQVMDVNTRLAAHVHGEVHEEEEAAEKRTCGECKHPWRKADHEDFPCFDHPGLAIGNYEKPSWRLEKSEVCPNFEAIQ